MADEFGMAPLIAALNGGEDYELLLTVPLSEFDKVGKQAGISIIGHITKTGDGNILITDDGSTIALKAQGWDGLSRKFK